MIFLGELLDYPKGTKQSDRLMTARQYCVDTKMRLMSYYLYSFDLPSALMVGIPYSNFFTASSH